MFGDHGLCGLLEEGAHGKSPKCLDGNLGDFGGILQRSLLADKGLIDPREYGVSVMAAFGYRADEPKRAKTRQVVGDVVQLVE